MAGGIKLDIDGAFDDTTGKASVGVVARDSYGNVPMAFTSEVRAQHPLGAELLALQRSLIHLSSTPTSSNSPKPRGPARGRLSGPHHNNQNIRSSNLGNDAPMEAYHDNAKHNGEMDSASL